MKLRRLSVIHVAETSVTHVPVGMDAVKVTFMSTCHSLSKIGLPFAVRKVVPDDIKDASCCSKRKTLEDYIKQLVLVTGGFMLWLNRWKAVAQKRSLRRTWPLLDGLRHELWAHLRE